MDKPTVSEIFADNGEHSHWVLVDSDTGATLWSEVDLEVEIIKDYKKAIHPLSSTQTFHSLEEFNQMFPKTPTVLEEFNKRFLEIQVPSDMPVDVGNLISEDTTEEELKKAGEPYKKVSVAGVPLGAYFWSNSKRYKKVGVSSGMTLTSSGEVLEKTLEVCMETAPTMHTCTRCKGLGTDPLRKVMGLTKVCSGCNGLGNVFR